MAGLILLTCGGRAWAFPIIPMAPIPVLSGNLRLSLVLVPVRLFPATSTEGTIAFRMIHEPSGKPINYLKGIETDHGFEEVPEEEIIKGYEAYQGTSRSHQARGNRRVKARSQAHHRHGKVR